MRKILLLLISSVLFSSVFAVSSTTSKDPEIVAFMIILNKNEIAAADVTKQKKVNTDIAKYADLMLKEHNKNLTLVENISTKQKIAPLDTNMAITLKEKGNREINTLTPLVGGAYETAYIDAMVKGHTEALARINLFLKEVKNPQLKNYLKDTRNHVKYHLAKAKTIQKEIQH